MKARTSSRGGGVVVGSYNPRNGAKLAWPKECQAPRRCATHATPEETP